MVARALTYVLLLLYLTLGATISGILTPTTRQLAIGGLIIFGGIWLIGRRRWAWHATVLDGAIPLWIVAFAISLIANLDQWRRIMIGIWYAGAYIIAWYVLHDLLANVRITRRALMTGVLLAGLLVIGFGFLQTRIWFTSSLPLMFSGVLEFSLPRPVSTLGNANTLGAFLAVLLPFAFELMRLSKGLARALAAVYFVLASVLLIFTYSRGAWIGAASGLGVYTLLVLWKGGWLSLRRLQAIWRAAPMLLRAVAVAVMVGIVAVGALAGTQIVRSVLGEGGRSASTRLWIYDAALRVFSEQPLTGSGLYTFGAGLAQYYGIPPAEPHAHAHNIVLHVSAELGLIGLAVLLITGVALVTASLRNLRADPVIAAGLGASAAFVVHHLFDVPSLNPSIALMGLIAFVVAAAPSKALRLSGFRRQVMRFAVPLVALALVISGFWSNAVYQRYIEVVSQTAGGAISFRDGADRLQSVVDADPDLSLYSYEMGYLYGLAGDTQAAIRAFERYTELEPNYPMGWMNLFALYEQAGDLPRALAAVQRAHELSAYEPTILYHLAQTQTAVGAAEAAQQTYERLLLYEPDLQLLPEWDDDPFRSALPPAPLSDAGQVIVYLQGGDIEGARALWMTSDYRAYSPSQTGSHVLDMLIALHEDDRAAAADSFVAAQAWILAQGDVVWEHYGAACLARFDGNEVAVESEIRAAHEALDLAPFESDWQYGANIAYSQFMRLAITRMFLPAVEYPLVSPVLRALLETFDSTADSRYTSCP